MGIFSRLFGHDSGGEAEPSGPERRPSEEEKIFSGIRVAAARQRAIEATKLNEDEEALAERIKKLLLSASWNNGRNQRAFENIGKEMKQLGKQLQTPDGNARWLRVRSRVEVLCGEHFVGVSDYLELLEDAPQD